MSVLCPILVFVGGATGISFLFKRKFEEALPLFILLSIVTLYVLGLFTKLSWGVYLIILISLIGFITTIISTIKKNQVKHFFVNYIFTPGLLACLIITFLLVFVINRSRVFVTWDDFSHWGIMIKETLRLDTFYNASESILKVHLDYPPAITLFEYLWCRLAGGVFSEQAVFNGLHFFTLMLLLPIFKIINWKKIVKFICLFLLVITLPSTFGMSLYTNIYIDIALAMLFSYALTQLITNNELSLFASINFILSCLVLMITKQIGIFFVGALFLFLVIKYCLEIKVYKLDNLRKLKEFMIQNKMVLITVGVGLFIVVFGYLSWKIYLNTLHINEGQFNISDISFSGLLDIVKGNGLEYQTTTLTNYAKAILDVEIISFPIPITFFTFSMYSSLGGYLLYRMSKHTTFNINTSSFALLMPVLSILYVVVLLLLYLFCFGAYEGPSLASYERYAGTYMLGIFTSIVLCYFTYIEFEELKKKYFDILYWIIPTIIICLMITPIEVYGNMLRGNVVEGNTYRSVEHEASVVSDYLDADDKVYIIFQEDNGAKYYGFLYFACPIKINESNTSAIGSPTFENDIWTKAMSLEEWKTILIEQDYSYVYLGQINQLFVEEFSYLFETTEAIMEKTLYKIESVDSNIILVPILEVQ